MKFARSSDVDDLVQEASIAVWVGIESFKPVRGTFSKWVGSISWRVWARHLETEELDRKRLEEYIDVIADAIRIEAKGKKTGPSDELLDELLRALQTLTATEFAVVYARFFDGLTFAEIADALSINESAARMRIFRILEELRRFFKNLGENEEDSADE